MFAKTVIFFGLGSIGRRHARLIHQHFPDFKLYRWAKNSTTPGLEFVIDMLREEEFNNLSPTSCNCFICTPTEAHVETVKFALSLGFRNFFLEKPISVDFLLDKDYHLLDKCSIYVAYPLRFLSLPKWVYQSKEIRFTNLSDATAWPSRRKINHVLLECSHEFDLAESVLGSIRAVRWVSVPSQSGGVVYCSHVGSRRSFLHLSVRSSTTVRVMESEHRVLTYGADDGIYLKQLQYFFDKRPSNFRRAYSLFSKIVTLMHNGEQP